MIEVQQLYKSFGNIKVLNGLNISLSANSCISLIGPNASGKTTLLKIILGIVKPNSGAISLMGENALEGYKYRENIGYMPQIGKYPDNMTVEQVINLLKSLRSVKNGYDEDLIDAFKLNKIFNSRLNTLSGGTRQKVSACIAFLFNSPILILDEPTAGLDPMSAEILKNKIQAETKKGKLILITSHILSDLEDISTHIVYLHEGKILFFETINELLEKTDKNNLSQAIAHIMRTTLYVENN